MNKTVHIDTDVLVIGGGLAGSKAALDVSDSGLKTVMVVKGLLGRSGCSIFAGNLSYFAPPENMANSIDEKELEQLIERNMIFLLKYTHYLGDQEYIKKASIFRYYGFFPWMEKNGAYFLRDKNGEIINDLPLKTSFWVAKMGMSGTLIMDMARKLILGRDNISVLEETAATTLLKNDDEVVGATALDYAHGIFYIIHAKVVILATGHSNHLSLRSTGTRDGSADGWVLAYNAGACLQDIEMQWYHASDVAYPATWMRLHLYPNPLPGTQQRCRLYNRDGELFFDGNWYKENSVPYIMQLKHLARQVMAGKARFDGDYYASYTHVEPEVLDKYIYQTQFMEKIGVDLKTEMMECGITWHMNVGGVRINTETMETGIPGFLIAGAVGGHVTGGLENACFDGTLAAKTAILRARSMSSVKPMIEEEAGKEKARVYSYLRTDPRMGLLPRQVKKRIWTTIWNNHNYIKNQNSMQEALNELQQIRDIDIPKMRLGSSSTAFNHDWLEAIDVSNMITALELAIQFSMFRKESRGSFYREDYPKTDNDNWLVHVVGHCNEAGNLLLDVVPVDTPYAKPKEGIVDFFDVDY